MGSLKREVRRLAEMQDYVFEREDLKVPVNIPTESPADIGSPLPSHQVSRTPERQEFTERSG